jgi:hypothetical protein
MELQNQQLVEIVDQGTQQLMPVPIPESGMGAVPKGLAGTAINRAVYKPWEHNRANDMGQYCNFIPPAPRDPLVNVPYLGEGCPYDAGAKKAPEGCFLVKNKTQNSIGFVCKDAGGTKNANFVRGNQFGVDYDMDVDGLSKSKKAEYTIENPVQLPIQMHNPVVKYDKSTFYPTYLKSYEDNGNEYPHPANYTKEPDNALGVPEYVFPYKVINPVKSEKDVIRLTKYDTVETDTFVNPGEGKGAMEENGKTVEYAAGQGGQENFEGINHSKVDSKYAAYKSRPTTIAVFIGAIILIILAMMIFCRKIELGCLWRKLKASLK